MAKSYVGLAFQLREYFIKNKDDPKLTDGFTDNMKPAYEVLIELSGTEWGDAPYPLWWDADKIIMHSSLLHWLDMKPEKNDFLGTLIWEMVQKKIKTASLDIVALQSKVLDALATVLSLFS